MPQGSNKDIAIGVGEMEYSWRKWQLRVFRWVASTCGEGGMGAPAWPASVTLVFPPAVCLMLSHVEPLPAAPRLCCSLFLPFSFSLVYPALETSIANCPLSMPP